MPGRAPWWRSNAMLIGIAVTVVLAALTATVDGAIKAGRAMQQLDDLTSLLADTRTQVAQVSQQTQHIAQGVAQIEGELGIRSPEHAALVTP